MDTFSLKALVTICELGSFLKASKQLNVTQPTLSKRIERLEYQLNAKLFERKKGISKPTELALAIAANAEPVFAELSHLESDITALASGSKGLVRLGLGPATFMGELTSVLVAFKAKYPKVTLEITTSRAQNLLDALSEKSLDIVIAQITADLQKDQFSVGEIQTYPIIAVAAKSHVLAARKDLDIISLFSEPAALPYLAEHHKAFIEQQFLGRDWQSQESIYCSDYSLLKSLTNTGQFFTVGPDYLFKEEINAGDLVKLDINIPLKHRISYFTSKNILHTPDKLNFLQMLKTMPNLA